LKATYPNYTGQIDKALDEKFYSFWHIEPENVVDSKCLFKMYCFNHLFYAAFREKATDWVSFRQKVLAPLSVEFRLKYNSPRQNVFTHSLLRSYCVEGTEAKLQRDFESTMQKMTKVYDDFIEIIDVKYLTHNYFLNKRNTEEIKTRSVRKQFVYEYLLQKYLERK
jgi:hypothetical protein